MKHNYLAHLDHLNTRIQSYCFLNLYFYLELNKVLSNKALLINFNKAIYFKANIYDELFEKKFIANILKYLYQSILKSIYFFKFLNN